MNEVRVPGELHRKVRDAMEMPFRFERPERYAMSEILRAAGKETSVERVYVDIARDALARHGLANHAELKRISSNLNAAA